MTVSALLFKTDIFSLMKNSRIYSSLIKSTCILKTVPGLLRYMNDLLRLESLGMITGDSVIYLSDKK